MKNIGFLSGMLLLCVSAWAQPVIVSGGIKNSASYAAQGLPNSAIAEGAIFSVFGTNLGPDTAEFGFNYPLPTVTPKGKVSLNVTVNGTTTQAIILYSGKTQINAVLPSSTPVGTGTATVVVNGQSSAPVPITVVKSNFGTYSVNSQGSGPGIVTFADYSLVTITKSANPGETLILWGTGLGPVSGNEGAAALPGDQPGIPAQVYVGGSLATIAYRGRSGCCAGLDQIAFVVPPNVTGCAVPVAVQIGDQASNFTTMSVAASGRSCTDATTGLSSVDYTNLFSRSSASYGSVLIDRSTSTTPSILGQPGTTTTSDSAVADFIRFTFAPGTSFNSSLFKTVSLGACTVTSFSGANANPFPGFSYVGLDAGAAITLSGPAGNRTLVPEDLLGKGFYLGDLGNGTPGNFLDPGQYTISGSGGADVSAFTTKITLPTALVWTNQNAITTVNRAAGQVITWTGGDPASYVSIDGSSLVVIGASNFVSAGFHCEAKVSAGQFTIPSVVLLSLPASAATVGGVNIGGGTLSVGATTTTTTFKATGLDFGLVIASTETSKSVQYQ